MSFRIVFQTFRSGNCSVFPQNPPDLSLRGGRIFAPDAAIFDGTICHPVTNYGRAERNKALEGGARKRNDAAIPMFFVIGISSCFMLPCFDTGCHAFGFQIATAALRPRNDTELERFNLDNGRFSFFFGYFLRGIAPHRFSNVSFRKLFRFPAKSTRFVIARRARAPDAAIFDETICRPETNYGCAERNRTINKERESGMKQRIPFFVIGISSCFVLPCFATGCHTFGLKIATAALRPRNDTKLRRFLLAAQGF